MHILCSTDKNYIMPTGVMMKSVSVNNEESDICFHVIIDKSVSWWQKWQLRSVVKGCKRHHVEFYVFDDSLLDTFPAVGEVKANYITNSAYYRLFAEKLLSHNIEKVLYLDVDIVVNKPLRELWNTDLSDFGLASVTDMSENMQDFNRLGYNASLGYFNSGVLLINLKYWRKNHITDEFVDLIVNHPEMIKFHDQDVLNIVFCRNKLYLPFAYNLQSGFMYKPELMELDYEKYKQQIKDAIEHRIMIHFCCSLKPWHEGCENPLKDEWLKYQAMTRWRHCHPKSMYALSLRVRVGNILRRFHILHPLQVENKESLQYIQIS